jgi:hypothetical protein
MEKSGPNKTNYVSVALGSRDRSLSVWSTHLKRPFFVIDDVFEQSILDLSWSKDGRVLVAWLEPRTFQSFYVLKKLRIFLVGVRYIEHQS